MVKADDTSSTIDEIWLSDALTLAVKALGSVALAKRRLKEWLAAGELPWSCMDWRGVHAEGLASWKQEHEELIASGRVPVSIMPSTAYSPGDPEFWNADLDIEWEDNVASENATCGAKAMGIVVSHMHLLALLPEEPRKREEALRQTEPAERNLMEPKVWLATVRKDHPRRQNEKPTAYARRLHALMQTADVTRVLPVKSLRRRLYDK